MSKMGRRTACLVLATSLALAGPAGARPRLVRPDLRPLAPARVLGPVTGPIGFSATSVTPYLVDGCLVEEMIRTGARRCLRFDTVVLNAGPGPLELAYGLRPPDAGLAAYQRVYRSNGSYRERFAAETEYHPTHTHFHFKDFYVTELWRADARGGRLGKKPVSVTKKNGFCPEDSSNHSGEGAPRYSCRTEYDYGPDGAAQVVGISAGYTDAYPYEIADQFLEISGVDDGLYLLDIAVDPDGRIVESSDGNNRICVVVRLEEDEARLAGEVDGC